MRKVVIAAILDREPAPLAQSLPGALPELDHVLGKALRKDREERYQSIHIPIRGSGPCIVLVMDSCSSLRKSGCHPCHV